MKIKKYTSTTWSERYPDFHVFQRSNANNDDEHIHDFIELVYVLGGEAEEVVDGTQYVMKRGDLLIMNYGCRHIVNALNHLSYVNILVYPKITENDGIFFQRSFFELVERMIEGLPQGKRHDKISFVGAERKKVEDILMMILKEQDASLDLGNIMRETYMIALLVEICRKQRQQHAINVDDFDEVLLFINNNIAGNFSLEMFSRKFFYNPSYFSRLFKIKTGVTFREYLFKKRMETACGLLKSTDMSVEEIIELVGYESRSSFFRNFHKTYGLTPLECRKQEKTDDKQKEK